MERLAFQCLALEVAFGEGIGSGLTWLLEISDSTVTYRSRYLSSPEWLPVLDLLVLDAANPRSVMFQASGIFGYLGKLEEAHGACGSELFAPQLQALQRLDPESDLRPESANLRNTIAALRSTAFAVSDRLTQRFFNHAQAQVWATLGL